MGSFHSPFLPERQERLPPVIACRSPFSFVREVKQEPYKFGDRPADSINKQELLTKKHETKVMVIGSQLVVVCPADFQGIIERSPNVTTLRRRFSGNFLRCSFSVFLSARR